MLLEDVACMGFEKRDARGLTDSLRQRGFSDSVRSAETNA